MGKAVIGVVHRHARGRGLGSGERFRRKLRRERRHHRTGRGLVAADESAGHDNVGALLLAEQVFLRQRRKVEL